MSVNKAGGFDKLGSLGLGGDSAKRVPGKGLININNILNTRLSRKDTTLVLKELVASFSEILESREVPGEILILDKEKNLKLPVSGVIYMVNDTVDGKKTFSVHTVILEDTMDVSRTKIINIDNMNVEEIITPGDLYPELFGFVKRMVIDTVGETVTVLDTGANVIPKGFDVSDVDNVLPVIYEVVTAANAVLDSVTATPAYFSIGMLGDEDKPFVTEDFDSVQGQDAVGNPIRSDVNIGLKSIVEGGQTIDLTSVDTYVDLVYVPPTPPAYGQPPATQHYIPRIVVTSADTVSVGATMELQLLALTTTTVLARNMGWAGAFKPRHGVKGTDTRDIGAVGYEIKLSDDPKAKLDKVNLKSKSVSSADAFNFISRVVRDAPIISLDVNEVGGNSWIDQSFIAAANGSKTAHKAIVDAANRLTNGEYDRVLAETQSTGTNICLDENNRIHLGFFTDENGVKRDLRTIDYLAILNIAGKQDPSIVVKWADTFENTNIPIEIRMERRARILSSLLNSNLEITGYARRVTFDPVFLRTLALASARAGLHIQSSYSGFSAGEAQRGNTRVIDYAVDGTAFNGMFVNANSGYGNYSNGAYYGRYTN